MKIHLIGIIYDIANKKEIGFRLLDSDSGQVMDQTYNAVAQVLASKNVIIHGIEFDGQKLKGSNGSFDRYTKIVNNSVYGEQKVVIINEIKDYGYTVSNCTGIMTKYSEEDLLKLLNKLDLANGKVVTSTKRFISPISGKYDIVIPKVNKANKNTKKNLPVLKQRINMPRVVSELSDSDSKLKVVDNATGMTVEQKMVYTMMTLEAIKPFYYSILYMLNRKESTSEKGVDTLAVSLDSLYFNSDFVVELTPSELLFIIIHEVLHIAMKHRIREKKRIHETWNLACDFYINSVIADEFGLSQLGEEKNIIVNGVKTKYTITLPSSACYEDSVDIYKDTPEKIYNELIDENSEMSMGGGNSDNDIDPDDTNFNNDTSESNQSNKPNNQNGNEDSNNENREEEDQGQGQGNQQENQQGQGSGSPQESQENQSSDDGGGSSSRQGSPQNNQSSGLGNNKKFRGKPINKNQSDIVDDKKSTETSDENKEQSINSLINRAIVVYKQKTKKSFGGEEGSFVERLIERELAPKIRWRTLLKNHLTLASQTINTFSSPDKRFRSRNMIIPGPKKLDNDALKNIKICCDTSGSISDKELGIVLAQVEQLLKTFHAEAEMIYWDTQVRAVYPFKNIKELIQKKPLGGGGTDANCIFEYFETNRDYRIGKKQKPEVIVVFTDGYFDTIRGKYKNKFRNTIWVISDNPTWKPPFGKVAPMSID